MFTMLLLSNIAGNSGGGVVLFVAQIFYGFSVKSSVGISVSINGAGSVARYFINWNQRNPKKPNLVL